MHSGPYTRKYPTAEDLRNAWFVPCKGMVIPENFEQEMVERVWDALGKHYTPWYRRAWDAVVRLVRWQ